MNRYEVTKIADELLALGQALLILLARATFESLLPSISQRGHKSCALPQSGSRNTVSIPGQNPRA